MPDPVDEFLSRLRHLRLDRSKGVAKPYKPLLLAAVVLLIGKGKLRSPDIALDGGIVSAFRQLLSRLFPDWNLGRSAEYPFRHLETDGVWTLIAKPGEVENLEAARGMHEGARRLRGTSRSRDSGRGSSRRSPARRRRARRYSTRSAPGISAGRAQKRWRASRVATG